VASRIISRFAPAPTGFLHLGHVVNAIHVWGVTRASGGRVLLRIEDHDRQRSRPEFERAILDDLSWLGFEADERFARQSDRAAIYEAALEQLRIRGLAYACECSRSAFAAAGSPGAERRYPGTCAAKGLAAARGRGIRVRLPPLTVRFTDRRHGPQEQIPAAQCGDLLARDRDGNWTYQFAVTVDDLDQGVTLVVRGDDLLSSTGRQIQIAGLLGRPEPPEFLHHALIMKSAAQKLSKSGRDTGIRELRTRGWTAPQVIGQAAFLAGLTADARPIEAGQVSNLLSGGPIGDAGSSG
jgi:glutamyl-tRNA synthetase/glutamyl-Q tRNA(Asp) synthetase